MIAGKSLTVRGAPLGRGYPPVTRRDVGDPPAARVASTSRTRSSPDPDTPGGYSRYRNDAADGTAGDPRALP